MSTASIKESTLEILNDPKKFLILSMIPLALFIVLLLTIEPSPKQVENLSPQTKVEEKEIPKEPESIPTKTEKEEVINFVTSPIFTQMGVVTERQGIKMRSQPTTESEQIEFIPFNQKIKVIDGVSGPIEKLYNQNSRWLKIEFNGKEGWAFGGFIKRDTLNFTKLVPIRSDASKTIDLANLDPKHVFDDKNNTIWGTPADENHWVEAELKTHAVIAKLTIANGYMSNSNFWTENNRVKKMNIRCMDGNKNSVSAYLYDVNQLQDIYLPVVLHCKTVRFTIEEKYPGTKNDYTYIADIKLQGKVP